MSEEPQADGARGRHPVAIAAGLALIAIALRWVLGPIVDVLALAFAGVLLAVVLDGLARALASRTPLGRRASLAIVCLVLLALGGAAVWIAAPEIARQIDELTSTLPRAYQALTDELERYGWGRALLDKASELGSVATSGQSVSRATSAVGALLGALGSFLVLVFVGLFVAIDPGLYRRGAIRLVPPAQRAAADDVLARAAHVLRMWTLGKAASMIVVGVATWIGLALIGLPLALTLAILAALLTFVPYFGPVIAAVPAVLLGFLEGPTITAAVAGLYLGVQLVESYVLEPVVQQRTASLPPALTILAQVVLGAVLGPIGIVIATPLTAAAMVVVQATYVERVLEREPG